MSSGSGAAAGPGAEPAGSRAPAEAKDLSSAGGVPFSGRIRYGICLIMGEMQERAERGKPLRDPSASVWPQDDALLAEF